MTLTLRSCIGVERVLSKILDQYLIIIANIKGFGNNENEVLKPFTKPEDHWSCIAYLSAEDMLKSVVIEEKK